MATRKIRTFHCSFCGKSQDEVERLLAGPNVFICNECISACNEFLRKEQRQEHINKDDIPLPQDIKKSLDDYVIGQEEAKKTLSVAVYNHYKRIKYHTLGDEVEIDKSNILLIGPTGSGKTLMARTLARILKVPFAIADATTLTEAGYVGEDVENILVQLLHNADYDIESASKGIIYIDEIDKISRKSEGPSITRDVSGEGVQQALLKIIEGTIASIPPKGGRKHPQQEYIRIDTSNILFIVGGAFIGLEDVVRRRIQGTGMGFGVALGNKKEETVAGLLRQVHPSDLIHFGLIPEFVGRISVITTLTELDVDDLVRVLLEPKNAIIKQYKKMFEMEGVDLEFTDNAVRAIAAKSIQLQTGARGLRSILESIMLDIMYRLPSIRGQVQKCIINRAVVEEGAEPIYVSREQAKSA